MLGENGREGRRHVLHHQHRRLVDHAVEPAEKAVERLRSAGRRADQQDARRCQRQRTQLQGPGFLRRRRERRTCDLPQRGLVETLRGPRRDGRGRDRSGALAARTQCPDLVDQLAAERRGGRDFARGLRLRDVVGGAERERAQADLGVAARQRRRHDHDEVALLFQQPRQRRDAVGVGHVDVEDDDVGIGALELLDGLAAAAHRADDLQPRFRLDPARQQAAHDDGVVDDHHPDGSRAGFGTRRGRGDSDTHRATSTELRTHYTNASEDQIRPTS